MIQSLMHKSDYNNLYLYDYQLRLSMLIHPEFKKVYEKSNDADTYYLKKYEYLKSYDFFSNLKSPNFGTLDELTVKETIFQTIQITFEVTDFCNLNCAYCTFGELYEGFETRNQKNIDTHNAINLLKYIVNLRPQDKRKKLMIGFYGGEPLLNGVFIKQIIEEVDRLKIKRDIDVEFSMTTNATLIHKYIHFLAKNNFQILISLDGNEENHSYRLYSKNEKNSFSDVINNIDMVQKNYPDFFLKNISFNAVLHDRNSVKDIIEFIYTRYHKMPRISQIASDDIKLGKEKLYYKMFQSKRKSEAEYQKEKSNILSSRHEELSLFNDLTDFLKYYSINYYVSNITSLFENEEKKLPTNTCLPGQRKIFLNNRNKLLACERINHKFVIGEVNENVVMDVQEITRQYNYYFSHIKKVCKFCYTHRYCGVCIFQMKNLDKLDTNEFICENFCDFEAFKNKLYRVFSFLEKYPTDFCQIIENVVIE